MAPALGRNDGANAAKLFDQRLTQVDVRFTKMFRFGGNRRVQGIVDLYNVFNNRPAQGIINQYGPSWLNATAILTGRLLKFGAQVDW